MDEKSLFDRLLQRVEKVGTTVKSKFSSLRSRIANKVRGQFDKYGNDLTEHTKGDRFNQLQKSLDNEAVTIFSSIRQTATGAIDKTVEEGYMMYTYLLNFFKRDKQPDAMKRSKGMMSRCKEAVKRVKGSINDTGEAMKYIKDELVYRAMNDIRDVLVSGLSDVKEAVERVTKRVDKAQTNTLNHVQETFYHAYSSLQDVVYKWFGKQFNLTKVWMSRRDDKVRAAHRQLDGQEADAEGYFHYGRDRATGPKKWATASMNYNCRCRALLLMDKAFMKVSKTLNYADEQYVAAVRKEFETLWKNGVSTEAAMQRAMKKVKPPKHKSEAAYFSYEEWRKEAA